MQKEFGNIESALKSVLMDMVIERNKQSSTEERKSGYDDAVWDLFVLIKDRFDIDIDKPLYHNKEIK